MEKYPDYDVIFWVNGIFDVDEFTKIIQIKPNECEMSEQYCSWELKYTVENYDDFNNIMKDFMSRLQGKETLILEYFKKYDLEAILSIGIVGEITYFPDIVLSPEVSLFLGKLNIIIDIDTVAYRQKFVDKITGGIKNK